MRLSFNTLGRGLLRRFPVINFYSLAELILLALLAVQSARLIWAIVTPVGPLGEWRVTQPGVAGSPAALLKGIDPFFRIGATANGGQATITSLQLKLFGTRLDDASGQGSAIIAGPDGVQNSVGVGEEVVPGAILKSVAFDHVTIDRGGKSEDLYIDQSGVTNGSGGQEAPSPDSAPSAAPAPGSVFPTEVTAAQIKSDVAFIPRIDGGQLTGLTVRPQGAGAGFAGMGLKEGDVIVQLGGRPVASQADIDRTIASLKPGSNLSLVVERGANTLPLAVTIKGQ